MAAEDYDRLLRNVNVVENAHADEDDDGGDEDEDEEYVQMNRMMMLMNSNLYLNHHEFYVYDNRI